MMELSSELANFDLGVITERSFNQYECARAFARPVHKFWDFHRISMGFIAMMKARNGILMPTSFIVIVIRDENLSQKKKSAIITIKISIILISIITSIIAIIVITFQSLI